MTWFSKFISNAFALTCILFGVFVLFGLTSRIAFGKDISGIYQLVTSPSLQDNKATINTGAYGPFSSYYSSSFVQGDDICRVLGNNGLSFQVICFSPEITSGIQLTQTNESETIQIQLAAINSPTGKPMPEIIVVFPLANMKQEFFTQDTTERLLNDNSIFDEPCKLSYQIDNLPPVSKNLYCSSFLNYFDKYTGDSKLFYELRVRPTVLRSISKKTLIAEGGNEDWFAFFKTLLNHKEMKITLELNGNTMVAGSTLDLGVSKKLIARLFDIYYTDVPKQQLDNDIITEKIFGPFDYMACVPSRYVAGVASEGHKKRYKDIFLVNCNADALRVRPYIAGEKNMPPEWIYKFIEYTDKASIKSSDLKDLSIDFKMNATNRDLHAYTSIVNLAGSFFVATSFRYSLKKMEEKFFNSQLIYSTMNNTFQPDSPCTISYIIDGKLASSERFKCNSAYHIVYRDILIKIDVDYGFAECGRRADNACKKSTVKKATSFLKKITPGTTEILIEVKLEGDEAVRTTFDLTDFDFKAIDQLLKCIDAFE